jgi:hypothetical protein
MQYTNTDQCTRKKLKQNNNIYYNISLSKISAYDISSLIVGFP